MDESQRANREGNEARERIAALEAEIAALKADVKRADLQADHLNHCYEQCEIDRQAIAKERDVALMIARLTADSIAKMHEIVCMGIDKHFPRTKDQADGQPVADAGPGHAASRPGTGRQDRPDTVPSDRND
jgi:hypothetical protein